MRKILSTIDNCANGKTQNRILSFSKTAYLQKIWRLNSIGKNLHSRLLQLMPRYKYKHELHMPIVRICEKIYKLTKWSKSTNSTKFLIKSLSSPNTLFFTLQLRRCLQKKGEAQMVYMSRGFALISQGHGYLCQYKEKICTKWSLQVQYHSDGFAIRPSQNGQSD